MLSFLHPGHRLIIESNALVANTSYLDFPLPKRGEENEKLDCSSTVRLNRLHCDTESPTVLVAPELYASSPERYQGESEAFGEPEGWALEG